MKVYRIARKQILVVAFTLVTAFAWRQDTFFHKFVKTATPKEIRAAIKTGADVKARGEYGNTSLTSASINNSPENITTLLDTGAKAKVRDNTGKTVFDYAKENEYIQGTDAYWRLMIIMLSY